MFSRTVALGAVIVMTVGLTGVADARGDRATEDACLRSRPFGARSPWNTPVRRDTAFGSRRSAQAVELRRGGATINSANGYGVDANSARATDPFSVVKTPTHTFRHRIPRRARIAGGTDHTLVVVSAGRIHEYWLATKSGRQFRAAYGADLARNGSGVTGGTRASGFSVWGGVIRRCEVKVGRIEHALVLLLRGDQLRPGPKAPAKLQDNDAISTYSGAVSMGQRFAIPRSIDLAELNLSAPGRALARALQTYGTYVGDRSANVAIVAEPLVERGARARYLSMRRDWIRVLRPLLRSVQ